jgi:hypothetical protein
LGKTVLRWKGGEQKELHWAGMRKNSNSKSLLESLTFLKNIFLHPFSTRVQRRQLNDLSFADAQICYFHSVVLARSNINEVFYVGLFDASSQRI